MINETSPHFRNFSIKHERNEQKINISNSKYILAIGNFFHFGHQILSKQM